MPGLVYDRWGVQVHHGDNLQVLAGMPDASVDSVVTDPPAGVRFMGRSWDTDHGGRDKFVAWLSVRMEQAYRVLKPGGHALVWGLPRTSHWTAWAVEDAGFEVRDCLVHLFGSGFPKSLAVSLDDRFCQCVSTVRDTDAESSTKPPPKVLFDDVESGALPDERGSQARGGWPVCPGCGKPRAPSGLGTLIKPASEHWWLVRKPLVGTIASNVLQHGTGALNVDGCRIGSTGGTTRSHQAPYQRTECGKEDRTQNWARSGHDVVSIPAGRWPSNVVLSHAALLDPDTGEVVGDACAGGCVDGCSVAELDRQSGNRPAGSSLNGSEPSRPAKDVYGSMAHARVWQSYGDSGGASRFFPVFRWSPKAPAAQRPRVNGKAHPTVKSVELMRWLVRLVTPPGGTVLDLFAGTGTTGQAARAEGMTAILIEDDPESLPLIVARLDALPRTEAPANDELVRSDNTAMDLFSLIPPLGVDGAS